MFPYILQGSNLTVVIDNTAHVLSSSHPSYATVIKAIKDADWETVRASINPVKTILNWSGGNITINGDQFFWKGAEFSTVLTDRMLSMLSEGFSIEPLAAFMENLMLNPSKRAVTELYRFLEKNTLPITPDGHFLAYKKVRDDFLDLHSGTMDNAPGKAVKMERNMVDDEKERTCSTGLHFCGQSYLAHYGGTSSRTVILKINPRDVVSIPVDYNDAKGRACEYLVIGELGVSPDEAFGKSVQTNANGTETIVIPDEVSRSADTVLLDTPQAVDSKGRPLSMTANAIRKRANRAAARAQPTTTQPSTPGSSYNWPFPPTNS